MSRLVTLVLETHEELAPLIAPPLVIAGVAAAVLATLGLVVYSYRDVANRHADKFAPTTHDTEH